MVAYSGAITVCGGKSLAQSPSGWVSYLPLLLSWIVVVFIVKKKKGKRTISAALIAVTGALMITLTHGQWLPTFWYDVGSALLFFAVWFNTSFLSVVSLVQNNLKKRKLLWQK
jgi:hypothetical protein